ncbi:hypothetical protein C1645_874451 [Glomus cerebriforme]|uniref:Uncharacterized protein n=1 Tax=Glomus cerebriforme TaxID=658196 RepID=A0A397T3X5_9GLOM|nr:hypothetical protein C1645_874451 [Glomus cerebriforme]
MSRCIQKTMETSFNFYILQSNSHELLTVDIYKDNKDKTKYVEFDFNNSKIHLKSLKVKHLGDYVRKKFNISDINKLKLWKLNGFKYKNIREQNISTEEDIVEKLNGEEMEFDEPFNTYFQVELDKLDSDKDYESTNRTRDSANLGYVPRREGNLGGTLLRPDQLTSNTNEGISLTDKDTSKRPVVVKSLIDDLLDKRIILVRAPPYSGKTALTQLIEDFLVNSAEYSNYRIIRFSTLWGNDVGKLSDWKNFGEAWEKILGVNWVKWRGECQEIRSILIIDEVQKIYQRSYQLGESKPMDIDVDIDSKNITAGHFWETVKRGLQGSNDIYIIMFGAYGYNSIPGVLSTPVEIPEFNSKKSEETVILEQMWQKEFYRIGKRLLNGYFMSCDVGATFASNGYLDFYVDEPFNWAIEILREGRCMAKHAKKFDESTGIYKEITLYAKSIAIVDIRSESIKHAFKG